jgi:hypothetical protein
MRKRLVFLIVLFFLVSVSISYILSSIIFNLGSNSINYQVGLSEENSSELNQSQEEQSALTKQSAYVLVFLFLILVYLIYHIIYIELAPWFKMRAMKKREDPLELVEYLIAEIKKSERKSPSKSSVLISRLKHFYDYLPEEEKQEALKISGLKKYLN